MISLPALTLVRSDDECPEPGELRTSPDGQPAQPLLTSLFHLRTLHDYWKQLGDVPVSADDEIETDFYFFPAGTPTEDVWRWFDFAHPLGLAVGVLGNPAPEFRRPDGRLSRHYAGGVPGLIDGERLGQFADAYVQANLEYEMDEDVYAGAVEGYDKGDDSVHLADRYTAGDLDPAALNTLAFEAAQFLILADKLGLVCDDFDPSVGAGSADHMPYDLILGLSGAGVDFRDRPEVYGEDNVDDLAALADGFERSAIYPGDDGRLYLTAATGG